MIWSLFQAMQVIVAAMKRNYKYITKNEIDKEFLFFLRPYYHYSWGQNFSNLTFCKFVEMSNMGLILHFSPTWHFKFTFAKWGRSEKHNRQIDTH